MFRRHVFRVAKKFPTLTIGLVSSASIFGASRLLTTTGPKKTSKSDTEQKQDWPTLTEESVLVKEADNQFSMHDVLHATDPVRAYSEKHTFETKNARQIDLSNPGQLLNWMNLAEKFTGIDYSGAQFCARTTKNSDQVDHHAQGLINTFLTRAFFAHCNFQGADLSYTQEYHNRGFKNCNLSKSRFYQTKMDQSGIYGCDAVDADFSKLIVSRELKIAHSDLTRANFDRAHLAYTQIDYTDLSDANFQYATAHVLKLGFLRNFKGSNWYKFSTQKLILSPTIDLSEAKSLEGLTIEQPNFETDMTHAQARTLAEGGAVFGPQAHLYMHAPLESRRQLARKELTQAGISNRNMFNYFTDQLPAWSWKF